MAALTASEVELLQRNGHYMMAKVMATLAEMVFCGIYCVVVMYSIIVLLKRSATTARLVALSVTALLFSMSTTIMSLQFYTFIANIRRFCFSPAGELATIEGNLGTSTTMPVFFFAYNTLLPIEFLIGDAIVIWRTWVLWKRSWAMVIPIGLWLASAGMLIAERVVCVTLLDGLHDLSYQTWGLDIKLFIVTYTLSVTTNAASTAMIAYKAWLHRHFTNEASSRTSAKPSTTERVLVLFVESGLIYLVFWGVNVVTNLNSDYGPLMTFEIIWSSMGVQIVGLYPALIILLVELHRTIWDAEEHIDATSQGFEFAHQISTTTTDILGTSYTYDSQSVSEMQFSITQPDRDMGVGPPPKSTTSTSLVVELQEMEHSARTSSSTTLNPRNDTHRVSFV